MLGAFSGDFTRVDYYQAQAGYDVGPGAPSSVQSISGILQCVERRVKNSEGNLVTVRTMKFWTRKVLSVGWFIRAVHGDYAGIVYRLTTDNGWREEAGFTVYGLEKVVGDDGNATANPVSSGSVGTGDFA